MYRRHTIKYIGKKIFLIKSDHNVHFSNASLPVQSARYEVGLIGGFYLAEGSFFAGLKPCLPKSLGPSCFFLFHMMIQNIIKIDPLQYLAATRCRFLTLFNQKMDLIFRKSRRNLPPCLGIHQNRVHKLQIFF